jgi:hypothetical protein
LSVDTGIESPTVTQSDRRTIVSRNQTRIAISLRYRFQQLSFVWSYGKVHVIKHGSISESCLIGKAVTEFTVEGAGQYQVGMP